jgi:MOSC domain-containing protein YiiM
VSHSGRLASINVSRGGVPKRPVAQCRIGQDGLEGDRQADRRFHGGPDRAVTLFSADLIRALQAEGHPIEAGSIGENLTVSRVDWAGLVPGALLEVGAVRLQITKYASPCAKIAGSFRAADFSRVSEKLHPGWSRLCARVLDEGVVRLGDPVTVSPPPPLEASSRPDGSPG